MTATAILTDLTGRGVQLLTNGDRLTVEAPAGILTDDDRAALREHKADLLALLSALDPPELGPGYCPDCTGKLNLQDKARDAWFCPQCRAWCDGQGQPLPKRERLRPVTLEEQQARQLLDDLRAAGCGFALGGEYGDELRLTHPGRMDAGLWTRFENAGPELTRLAREAAEQDAAAWEARNEWTH